MIRFELEGHAIPLQNEWQRWHWRQRSRYIRDLAWLIRQNKRTWGEPSLSRVVVRVLRRSMWRSIAPDRDAVVVKPLLDVMQPRSNRHPYGLGIILDDSREVIRGLVVDVEKGDPMTIVEIVEALPIRQPA